MEQRDFEILGADFTAGDEFFGDLLNGGFGSFDVGFGFFFAAAVECDHDQAFGFQLCWACGGKCSFHAFPHSLHRLRKLQGAGVIRRLR